MVRKRKAPRNPWLIQLSNLLHKEQSATSPRVRRVVASRSKRSKTYALRAPIILHTFRLRRAA